MKVLYLHHVSQLGGSSTSLLHLIQNLPGVAIEPLVAMPAGSAMEAFRNAGIPVVELNCLSLFSNSIAAPPSGIQLLKILRTFYGLKSHWKIGRIMDQFKPDVVHLNERGLHHAAWMAKRRRIPVVMHARNVAARDNWSHRLCVGLMNRNTDVCLAIDGSVAHSLREVRNMRVVYNPGPAVGERTGNAAEAENGRPMVRVLFLSILIRYKGIWDFMDAVELLSHRNDIEFVIAGCNSRPARFLSSWKGRICRLAGLVEDAEARIAQALEENGGKNIRYLGFVSDVKKLLASCDIFVFPSHLNGPSRGVFEAGMHGIPTIISLKDRVDDVVKDGVNALVIPEKDPAALAAAIEKLADDPSFRRTLGENARKQYSKLFDPRRSAEQVLAVYRDLLDNKQPIEAMV